MHMPLAAVAQAAEFTKAASVSPQRSRGSLDGVAEMTFVLDIPWGGGLHIFRSQPEAGEHVRLGKLHGI